MSHTDTAPHSHSMVRDLTKGLLAATLVVAVFEMVAAWAAGLERWAAAEPAAAAPVQPPASAPFAGLPGQPVLEMEPTISPEVPEIVVTPPAAGAEADPLPPERPGATPEAEPKEVGEPTEAAQPGEYVVQEGDTLSAIAAAYGLTVGELAAANGLDDPDHVLIGQVLVIPVGALPLPSPTPTAETPQPVFEPADPLSVAETRWIDVDLSEQRLTAYEGQTPVRTTLVSTGLPGTPTPEGQFRIYIKYRTDDMAGPGYYIQDVPFVMYFYQGYGLHGVTWHGNFGHPMSHGCVNLPTEEAEWLFGWAEVGTLVNIHA